ncbi:MAG: putative terminase large subunit [Prokaryotic dsDNA virus sp.]|nr:MAG: putative terminase large subunit [Prokaryotic dsDNA virus sp.]
MSDSDVEYISVMKSARVGYTKCLNIIVASCMAETPSNVMVVQPTISDAEGYSTSEIMPMLRDVPCLQGLVADSKNRDNSNTMLRKNFSGGQLMLVGANSATGFRRVSVKVLCFDEVDGYPTTAGAEGDQIKLGIRRTEYFHDRKIIMGSTPTLKGYSRIEDSFERSDKRRYFVPCPFCDHYQYLQWSRIEWEKDKPKEAKYRCENEECDKLIPHSKKRKMVERGEWRATAPFDGHAGFHIWAAYSFSPNATWGHLAVEFLEAKESGVETLQTWVNTALGETWEDEANEGVDSHELANRKESYDASEVLPDGVVLITAGVDVQDDRLEVEILGIGRGEETWSLEYLTVIGDGGAESTWKELDEILRRTYVTPSGVELPITSACIDSGGHHTQSVYDFVRGKTARRIYAIKGMSSAGKPMVGRPSRTNKGKIPLIPLNTIAAKDLLFARLKLTEAGSGYCHFPSSYDDEYFAMLTAEKVATRYVKGVPKREYIQIRKRNEALDCRVYAMAALRLLNARLDKVAQSVARKSGGEVKAPKKKKKRRYKKITSRRPKGGGFVDSWKP